MRKFIYISFLLFAVLPVANAQKKFVYEDTSLLQKEESITTPVEDEPVLVVPPEDNTDSFSKTDTTDVVDTSLYKNDLYLPYDSIKGWKNQKEYAYTKYLDSLLKSKKTEVKVQPESSGTVFFDSILNSGFVRVLLWSLAIFFVLFIIYRLFLAEGVFRRRSNSLNNSEAEVVEEMITPETDFDGLIRSSLQNGNYRQAVRYQYLRTLHLLSGKHLIEMLPDKTNYQYVREIANKSYQQDFASLTLNYEYAWYGEFNIEKDIYQKIETGFINFNQKI